MFVVVLVLVFCTVGMNVNIKKNVCGMCKWVFSLFEPLFQDKTTFGIVRGICEQVFIVLFNTAWNARTCFIYVYSTAG